ncbi:MAG: DUF86 domain-containing protein [Candidatus Omnitrophica bacterium]|nr:DUF86 domain-containing protein [Candidatus Omnitrophota bacterium]
MLDKNRILVKIDELDGYLDELEQIAPAKLKFKEYQVIEKKRSCERLLQLSIEAVIDICKFFVSGMRLGLPAEENDLFDKMQKKKLLSKEMAVILKEMKGFRNILVHEYAAVDDELVFKAIKTKLKDFRRFKKEILAVLARVSR